ncbi:MAG: hypothetical protein EXR09_06880 [Acetobacteraceae bacterium]|nr:hypothetical protein [Acetobacteraceae bacterium]
MERMMRRVDRSGTQALDRHLAQRRAIGAAASFQAGQVCIPNFLLGQRDREPGIAEPEPCLLQILAIVGGGGGVRSSPSSSTSTMTTLPDCPH